MTTPSEDAYHRWNQISRSGTVNRVHGLIYIANFVEIKTVIELDPRGSGTFVEAKKRFILLNSRNVDIPFNDPDLTWSTKGIEYNAESTAISIGGASSNDFYQHEK